MKSLRPRPLRRSIWPRSPAPPAHQRQRSTSGATSTRETSSTRARFPRAWQARPVPTARRTVQPMQRPTPGHASGSIDQVARPRPARWTRARGALDFSRHDQVPPCSSSQRCRRGSPRVCLRRRRCIGRLRARLARLRLLQPVHILRHMHAGRWVRLVHDRGRSGTVRGRSERVRRGASLQLGMGPERLLCSDRRGGDHDGRRRAACRCANGRRSAGR
jgi:hypothetical protein